jgi:hypothetical protein
MSTKLSIFFKVGTFSDCVLVVIRGLLVMDALLEDQGWSGALARALRRAGMQEGTTVRPACLLVVGRLDQSYFYLCI